MPPREILIWPDPRLKAQAEPVTQFDDGLRDLLEDMVATMYAAEGIGLAAPQIGVGLRVFVVDPTSREDQPGSNPMHFINPEIVEAEGKTVFEEGCLSVPDESVDVERHTHVRVRARDATGEQFEVEAEGLMAIALQHELDHLDGVLLVDRLSSLKRGLVKKRMLALKAEKR